MAPTRLSSLSIAGYIHNPVVLRVKDANKSLKSFYDCSGLHVIFIFNVGSWTVYYLGHNLKVVHIDAGGYTPIL